MYYSEETTYSVHIHTLPCQQNSPIHGLFCYLLLLEFLLKVVHTKAIILWSIINSFANIIIKFHENIMRNTVKIKSLRIDAAFL